MKRRLTIASIATLAVLGGCGGHAADQNITLTNTDDVVLNDAQANYAFRGDNESVGNQGSEAVPADESMGNSTTSDDATNMSSGNAQ